MPSTAQSFQVYSCGTVAWLTAQALPLLVTPRILVALLESEVRDATGVETYLARAGGLALICLASLTICLSGILPPTDDDVSPSGANSTANDDEAASHKIYATPTLIITLLYHIFSGIHTYTKYTRSSHSPFLLGTAGSAVLAVLGVFALLFGDEKARGSRWPFESAEHRQKRKEKRAIRKKKGL